MNRLTEHDDQGNWCLKGVAGSQLNIGQAITKETLEKLYGALWKLKDYEDTGLTLEEIMGLKDKLLYATKQWNIWGEAYQKDVCYWIPVEKRLPETGTYLCTLDGELCGIDEPFTGMCGIENGKWLRYCLDAAAGTVSRRRLK